MEFPFFQPQTETPLSLHEKAEDLLARSIDLSKESKGSIRSGENRLKRAGLEGDFRQFRDYQTGDRPQDIDWKRSARSDDTLIREREKNQQRILDLYIQNYPGMHFRSSPKYPTKYEAAATLGMALGLWAARHHDPIRFWSQKTSINELAELILETNTPSFHEWQRNSVTVLIGDYTDPVSALAPVFSGISSQNVLFLQVMDKAEIDLPYQGRHIFEDGSDKIIINNTDSIRVDYQSALNSHLHDLRDYCRKRNWYYAFIRTDEDLAEPLNKALAAIGDTP